jgi:RNA polymerase sigma factor (sigma-70 family)
VAERAWLAERFEQQRPHLRAVAYRMLGSLSDADDAVQETWLRLSQPDDGEVENLRAWLTTIVSRVSLNMLRARNSRGEEPMETYVPDPVVSSAEGADPEQQAVLADSIGLALLVVLETLAPAERLAFVLHDMFAVSFEEIAPMVDRYLTGQRKVVDAFFAAAHDGDFERLVAVLNPEVVLRADGGMRRPGASVLVRGAEAVAARAAAFSRFSADAKPALVNGAAGVVVVRHGRPFSVMGFTVVGSRIVEIDVLSDPERLRGIELAVLDH